MKATILIIDNDQPLRELLCFALRESGYRTLEAVGENEAQSQLNSELPDLIVLEWRSSDIRSIEFSRALRSDPRTAHIPIILLASKPEQEHQVLGLGDRVEVYGGQPFAMHELLARIRMLLRLSSAQNQDVRLQAGELLLDTVSYRVTLRGQILHMGPIEFRLLAFFMANQDQVHTRRDLINNAWAVGSRAGERCVDPQIRRLRKALEPSGYDRLIQTVRGVGYRFSTRNSPRPATRTESTRPKTPAKDTNIEGCSSAHTA